MGLNPLLENPGMIVHPPALLAGYVGYEMDQQKLMAVSAAAMTLIGVFWKRDTQTGTGNG